MGYDVTFHPVSLDDLHRYVFDVIEQPDLAEARAQRAHWVWRIVLRYVVPLGVAPVQLNGLI